MSKERVRSVVVGVDGSAQAEEAFEQAVEICLRLEAPLRIVTVVPVANIYYLTGPPPAVPDEEQVRYHWELASRLVERAKVRGVKEVGFDVLDGNPVDAILDYLDRDPPGLLVVGARGLSRAQRLILGSVSSALVQQAKCSVMVAKPRSHPSLKGAAAQGTERALPRVEVPPR